jgi:sugar-specific transcriptional regulator TrmB
MNEKFPQLLKNIDLTATQIKIYLAVLRNGMSTVLDISKYTKINRSQIYLDTSVLIEKGLLELASKRKRKFLAVDPMKIAKIIADKKDKLKELEETLSETSKYFERQRGGKGDYDLKIFEGIKNVKKFFDFELNDMKGEDGIYLIGNVGHQSGYLSQEFWDNWNLEFTKRGNRARMIIDRNDPFYNKYKVNKEQVNVDTRGMENLDLKASIDVWRDNVFIVSFDKEMLGVYIKNKLVADTIVRVFEALWKQSE